MRIDLDTYREILDTLTRNKSRSFLTGFGVFWGVFMLIALMGGGQGLKEMLQQNFAGFATNSALVWAQPTSKAYKGFRKGRYWHMDYNDIARIRHSVPELDVIHPCSSRMVAQLITETARPLLASVGPCPITSGSTSRSCSTADTLMRPTFATIAKCASSRRKPIRNCFLVVAIPAANVSALTISTIR